MKISKHNYPILDKLYKGNLGVIQMYEVDKLRFPNPHEIGDLFKKFNSKFRSNIDIVSKPFQEAINKNKGKLIDLYVDIIGNKIEDIILDGTFIIGDIAHMIHFKFDKTSDTIMLVYMAFTAKGSLIHYIIDHPDAGGSGFWISKVTELNNDYQFSAYGYNPNLPIDLAKLIIVTDMLKKYASTEIKIIEPKAKLKGKTFIKNESDFKVNYLDSTWFTTTISNNPFAVKGHFRLQPKKVNGEWTKELIFIQEFEKKGYVRRSKINPLNVV